MEAGDVGSNLGGLGGGVLSSQPGARIEAVPGPDGYSGCGLEKPSPYIGLLAAGVITGEQCEQAEHGQRMYEECYDILAKEVASNKQKAEPILLSRNMFRLEDDEIGELRSTAPLTDKDRIAIAVALLQRVGNSGAL